MILMALLPSCTVQEAAEESERAEISLYDEHDRLAIPDDMQRELGVEIIAVSDTNAIPECAIIRGAQEDFTYVKDGKHFVRTRLDMVPAGAQIVARGVKDLWMIELLAIRGGEPCCR